MSMMPAASGVVGGRTLLAPRLVKAGTSLLTHGIIELTGAANVPDEEVLGRCLAYGVMTVLMRRFVWRTTPALDCRVG